MKHTHTGTCPACGRQQAVNGKTDRLSNHGYTIKYGWQQGTCGGSREEPAELSNDWSRLAAPRQRAAAAELEAKTLADVVCVTIVFRGRMGAADKHVNVMSQGTWEAAHAEHKRQPAFGTDYETARLAKLKGWHREATERRAYADFIEKLAAERLGQPLYAVAPEAAVEKVRREFRRHEHDAIRACRAELEAAGYTVTGRDSWKHGSYTLTGTRAA